MAEQEKDKRAIFLEAIAPFLSMESYRNVATNIDVIEQRLASQGYLGNYVRSLQNELDKASEPRPLNEWGEDYGDCLWWTLPVEETPYCGNPLDCNFPDYVTHFTRLIIPEEPK